MRHRIRLVVICLASQSACGWIAGEIAEQKARQDALEDFVYDDELPALWKELDDVWDAKGCELPAEPVVKETIDCEGREKAWLRVTPSAKGHAVEIEHEVERTDPEDPEKKTMERVRDWDAEWKLLKRTHPDVATEVENNAKEKGKKAKDAAKKLEEAFE